MATRIDSKGFGAPERDGRRTEDGARTRGGALNGVSADAVGSARRVFGILSSVEDWDRLFEASGEITRAVERAVPGRARDMDLREGQGPVVSVVGETYYVSYVELEGGEEGQPLTAAVLLQEEFAGGPVDAPFDAGKAYAEFRAMAPERRKEVPPEDPVERRSWEADVERARTDIIRMQVAIENNPNLSLEEIIEKGLDRPPEDRPPG